MPVESVNGCVIVPHACNWATSPKWKRKWKTSIGDGVTGAEDRQANRLEAYRSLAYSAMAFNHAERARLRDRIMAGLKSGKAAAPYWGRGQVLAADVTGTAVTLAAGSLYPWAVGDHIFLSDLEQLGAEAWDVREITAVAGLNLTLDGPVSRTYKAGKLCWPLLFGRLRCDSMVALTNQHGSVDLTIEEPLPVGAFVTAACPDELPIWNGGAPPGDETCPSETDEVYQVLSKYCWGLDQSQNPNELLDMAQISWHMAIFENELLDAITALEALGRVIKKINKKYWWWQLTNSFRHSAATKYGSGSTDPNDPTGETPTVYFTYAYMMAVDLCLEALP